MQEYRPLGVKTPSFTFQLIKNCGTFFDHKGLGCGPVDLQIFTSEIPRKQTFIHSTTTLFRRNQEITFIRHNPFIFGLRTR